ncbi:hypothetical protein [Treponema brennaborense]|uniref:Uncharacterized protein n=1 Tax=Treponema brennaborense (strain DSM 12168 / CIP 105900 / DD5/3) TaxID=906968 RepID=F4LMP2_TREBD|nr:hypothetical protein [Treponema brennaborense]AEE16789.1 hypothetical protein Trebr_1365 [Treponema brennaborense DSM 12168]
MMHSDGGSRASFSYEFSQKETELLAKFFRSYHSMIPEGLEQFRDEMLAFLYSAMTIDEAEAFFRD